MLPGAEAETLLEPGPLRRLLAGFPALRHRNCRLFVVGQGISLVGFWMQSVAQGWLVYRLEGRPLDLGKVAFAGYLPILCLAPFAGVVADRLPRRPVLLVTQSLLGLLALVLGVLVWTGAVTVPLVVLCAGGVGLVSALDVPTRQSFLVEMAGPEDLPNAIALNSSIFNGARLVGPALAGALVGALAAALQLAARRYSRAQHRRHLLLGLVIFALAVLGLAASRRLGLALACQTLAGYGMVRYLATTNTLLQLVVEDGYRGRIMGLHTVMFLGTLPLGSLVLGALAQRFGAPGAALVSGGVSLAAAGRLALRLRRVARRARAAAGAPGTPRPRVSTD